MKKLIALITTLILAFILCLPASAGTITHVDGPYTFHMTGGDSALVAVDPSLSGDVTIPLEARNYALNRISSDAYKDCVNITSVDIGDHVTSIFGTAFRGCTGLKTVYFNASRINSVGDKDNFAFTGCTSLSKIVIGGSVTSIPEYSFAGISSLKTIEWGGTTEIGKGAFMGSGIETLVIPEGVTAIKADSFKNCTSLKSVTIPKTVVEIDASAFEGCTSLKTVIYNAADAKVSASPFKTAENVTIGATVNSLPDKLFAGCTKLSTLTIENVNKIGNRTFEGCSSLKSVALPDSLKALGTAAFKGCSSLNKVTFGSGLTSISNECFSGCGLTDISVPETITRIGKGAFKGCPAKSYTAAFVGESAGISNSFIGFVFGASSYKDNASAVPAYLKTVKITKQKSVADTAFFGCDSISVSLAGNNNEAPTSSESTPTEPNEAPSAPVINNSSTVTTDGGLPQYVIWAIVGIAAAVIIGAVAIVLILKKK